MAVAGSSNLILHIPAIANEAGYNLPWWKYFDEASQEIPLMIDLAPGGPYSVKDFDLAGGMSVMLSQLMPKLNPDCLTVHGKNSWPERGKRGKLPARDYTYAGKSRFPRTGYRRPLRQSGAGRRDLENRCRAEAADDFFRQGKMLRQPAGSAGLPAQRRYKTGRRMCSPLSWPQSPVWNYGVYFSGRTEGARRSV